MATEEDNFDIDIYGDGGEDYQQVEQTESDVKPEQPTEAAPSTPAQTNQASETIEDTAEEILPSQAPPPEPKRENGSDQTSDVAQKIVSTDESAHDPLHLPKQAPQTQGLKRKDGTDDRFVDPGATTALFISELHWWITDDDIRGWANQSQCEDELEDMTFSEHKVNGKSKGQAYVLFKSPQAATAAKHKIESFGEGQQYTKKFTVSYTNPFTNPFRTLPKDGPMRNNQQGNRSTSGAYNNTGAAGGLPQQQTGYNSNAGFRGNRGGYNNNRSNGMPNVGGYNRGGFQQPMTGGFQATPMTGFQGSPMTNMQSYGGFQNRGGMMGGMRGGQMGMRGGRGGMIGMPMGAMGMGGLPGQMGSMGMGMPQMGAGMGLQGMQGQFSYPSTTSTTSGQYTPLPNPIRYNPNVSYSNNARSMPAPVKTGAQSTSRSAYPSPTYSVASAAVHTLLPDQKGKLKQASSPLGSTGFQGAQPHYNPAFFQQQQGTQGTGVGDSSWNPHGAKRTRQE